MLDTVISRVKEEIAIDGSDGAALDVVWSYVQRFTALKARELAPNNSREPVIDALYKAYIWNYLKCDLDLNFVVEADTNETNADENEDYMPCPESRKKYEAIADIAIYTYEQVESRYGSRMRVIASEKLQEEQLFIGLPPGHSITINLMAVLKAILQTKEKGVTQAHLTKFLDLDPRSTGHYVKSLEAQGAITRSVYSSNSLHTNLCIHARFGKIDKVQIDSNDGEFDDTIPYNVNMSGVTYSMQKVHSTMTELLRGAKNQTMYSQDLLSAMGFNVKRGCVRKWFNRCLDELCMRGYFRKLAAHNVSAGKVMRCSSDGKTRRYNVSVTDEELALPFVVKSRSNNPRMRLLQDATLEYQLLEVLRAAGTNGATAKEIGYAINCDEFRILYKVLDRMCSVEGVGIEKYGVRRALEFQGRQRRYRYYTYVAYMKVHEGKDVDIQEPPAYQINEKDLTEVDYQVIPPCTPGTGKKGRPRKYPKLVDTSSDTNNGEPSVPRPRGRPRKDKTSGAVEKPKRVTRSQNPTPENSNTITNESTETGPSTEPNETASELSAIASTPANASTPTTSSTPTTLQTHTSAPLKLAPIFERQKRNIRQTEPVQDAEVDVPPRKRRGRSNIEQNPVENHATTQNEPLEATPSNEHNLMTFESINPALSNVSPNDQNPAAIPVETSSQQKRPVAAVEESDVAEENAPPAKRSTNTAEKRIAEKPMTTRSKRTKISDFFGKVPTQRQTEENRVDAQISAFTMGDEESTRTETIEKSSRTETVEETPRTEAIEENVTSDQITPVHSTEQEVNAVDGSGNTEDAVDNNLQPMNLDEDNTTSAEPAEKEPAGLQKMTLLQRRSTRKKQVSEASSLSGVLRANSYKRKPSSQSNAYSEQRKRVVLELLKEKPIYERSREFRQMFVDKKEALYGPDNSAHTMCIKTLWRTAELLEQEGLAKIYEGTIVHLNGSTSKRLLVLRSDIDTDGPEVTSYLTYLRERKVLYPMTFNMSKYERVDNIEGLDERMERLKAEYASSVEQNHKAEAKMLETQIKSLKSNIDMVEAATGDISKGTRGNWMMIALQFGYIPPKMIRGKLLHQFMFGLVRGNAEGVDREGRVIPSRILISEMPFSLYLQVIGVFHPSSVIRQYINDPANLLARVRDAPEEIRTLLFSDQYKFRRRLRVLLDLLCDIGVASRIGFPTSAVVGTVKERESLSALALAYSLNIHVPMHDYRKENCPIVNEYDLIGATDIQIYWSDLQYLCTNVDDPERHEHNVDHVPTDYKAQRAALYNFRNWSTTYVFTKEQRRKLNSYVDKNNGTTPCKNIAVCSQICEELQLSMTMVRGYFRKLESAYERKMENRTLQKLERDAEPKPRRRKRGEWADRGENKMITLATTRAFQGSTYMTLTRKLARKQKGEFVEEVQNGELYMDDLKDVPLVNEREIDRVLQVSRGCRMKWSSQEDELLIYTNIILRMRSKKSRFLWSAAKKVLPEREANACRNRLTKLKENPKMAENMFKLELAWRRIYAEGIASGAIEDTDPYDMLNFDILGHLSYFIQRMQLEPSCDIEYAIQIPTSLEVLHEVFEMHSTPDNIANCRIDNIFHRKQALIQKHHALCVHAFMMNISDPGLYDMPSMAILREVDYEGRIVELLKEFFKMILMSPKETYDPFYAYAILNRYPEHFLKKAISESKDDGILVRARWKRLHDRRLPGMQLGISNRFINRMAGRLPENFLLQAREYEKYLHDNGADEYSIVNISSGMMACVLDLISEKKLNIFMQNRSLLSTKYLKAHNHSRNIDPKWMYFDMDLSLQGPRDDFMAPVELKDSVPQNRTELLTQIQFDSALAGLLNIQDDCDQPIIRLIVDILTAAGKDGVTLPELKGKLLVTEHMADTDIHQYLDALLKNVPPLVATVGFQAPRLVLTTDLESWLVVPKTVIIPKPLSQEICDRTAELTATRKNVVEPRVWIDVNGIVTESVLKGCFDVVVELVMERPGIIESAICRHFTRLLSRAEIKDLLTMLVQRGVLRKLSTRTTTGPTALFSKPKLFKTANHDTIDSTVITSYWTVPGFYNNTA
ncbi:hypothetical protein DFQ30_010488 [Apophysomyces sp. BC1015]|nr:hypothetical protein DFQ30_010488 [Apophysomyces sp. BC1015]